MPPRSTRRSVGRGVLALAVSVLLLLGWLHQPSAEAASTFSVRGRVGSLVPGVRGTITLTVRNPFGLAIKIRRIVVTARDASASCLAANVSSPGYRGSLKVRAGSRVKLKVPIMLSAAAPDACQGATFPLVFFGKATRA